MGFENATRTSVETMSVRTGIPDEQRTRLADGLAKILADTYTLPGKTHGFPPERDGTELPLAARDVPGAVRGPHAPS